MPTNITELSSTVSDDGKIVTKGIQFDSYDGKNRIFAYLVAPVEPGKYPGMGVFHAGNGSADKSRAEAFAREGFVAIAPDLPGIANPANCPNSTGAWKESG